MDWAKRRKWTVIVVLVAAVIAVLCIIGFAIFYKTPTCTDQKKDGDETGIDCGGSCTTVCSVNASPASVRFVRTLSQSGRIDLIAYIDNPNKDLYSRNVHFTVEAYDTNGSEITKHVSLSILPGVPTPLYIPGISSTPLRQAFVSIDDGYPVWMKGSISNKVTPGISNVVIGTYNALPRITATLSNPTAYPINKVPLVITVFDDSGTAIAASQTVVDTLPAQGTSQLIFTWNEPFSANAARVEIVPIIGLPMQLP